MEVAMNSEPEVVHQSDQYNSSDIPDFVGKWYGWGSPIGLSIALIAVGIVAVLIRIAIVGGLK
jgi:hypothetical protein